MYGENAESSESMCVLLVYSKIKKNLEIISVYINKNCNEQKNSYSRYRAVKNDFFISQKILY